VLLLLPLIDAVAAAIDELYDVCRERGYTYADEARVRQSASETKGTEQCWMVLPVKALSTPIDTL